MNNSKLNVKDLINVGLFTVIIFMATFVSGMVGFIPVLMPIIPFIGGIITGPIYMLYSTKIKKVGMFFITQMIISFMFIVTGHGFWILLTAVLGALVTEYILKKSEYKSPKKARLAFALGVTISGLGNWIPIFFAREQYYEKMISQGYGKEFADTMMSVLPLWAFVPVVLLGMLGIYIGCTIGISILKKHFEKAGMIEGE